MFGFCIEDIKAMKPCDLCFSVRKNKSLLWVSLFSDIQPTINTNHHILAEVDGSICYPFQRKILYMDIFHTIQVHKIYLVINHNMAGDWE